MIRDPQEVSPTNSTHRDPVLDPRFEEVKEPFGAGTVVAAALGALLLLAGAMWALGPDETTVATKPPITTTGQGSSSPLPSVPAPAPSIVPAAPSTPGQDPSTTGQGSSSMKPTVTLGDGSSPPTTHAPVPAPIAPLSTPTTPSVETNAGVDVEESPTMKK
jgi:hypothetical protein